MSTEPQDLPGAPLSAPAGFPWIDIPPPRPKFQHRYRTHVILFLLTFITTTLSQVWELIWTVCITAVLRLQPAVLGVFLQVPWLAVLREGLQYSVPILMILTAHEFGHYLACRYYDVDATLPYYIPAPLPMTGTLGAVIRIRQAFPSKQALFDIGVAGPIAGFVMLLPFLVWGMWHSTVTVIPPGTNEQYLGEPILWKIVEYLRFGRIADNADVIMNPVTQAAWFGMLATALNLLPYGQLDGGHIMYASVGRRAFWPSILTLVFLVLLASRSASWLVTAGLLTLMGVIFGFRHPRVIDEHLPLDRGRQIVAVLALIIFVLCFMPVPMEIIQR